MSRKKFKVGDCYHHKYKDGSGQLYVIVGINKLYLFLSYHPMYIPKDPGDVKVISIAEAQANEWPKLSDRLK